MDKTEGRNEGERRKYALPNALPATVLFVLCSVQRTIGQLKMFLYIAVTKYTGDISNSCVTFFVCVVQYTGAQVAVDAPVDVLAGVVPC